MKKLIAVTGGIGCGKSSVLRFLAEMGYPTFSCDEIYRDIILSPDYIQKISEVFPECIIGKNIDRKLLAEIIFKKEEKRAQLNQIAHPLIMKHLFERMQNCNSDLVFAEVPLLFEGNYQNDFDLILVVIRNKEERVRSIMERDNITNEEAIKRISAQFDYDNGRKALESYNAIFIENDGNFSHLKSKVDGIVKHIL